MQSVISEEQEESEKSISKDSHKEKVANFLKDLEEGSETNKGPIDTLESKEAKNLFQGKTLAEYNFSQLPNMKDATRNLEARVATAGPDG